MDRAKYKEKAKKLIEGKKWYLLKPIVMYNVTVFVGLFIILFVIGLPIGLIGGTDTMNTSLGIIGGIFGCIVSLVEIAFMFGYAKYCLDFVRGKDNQDWKNPINYIKENFKKTVIVSLLLSLMVLGGTILLVIPGIIIAIGHMFIQEVYVDNSKLEAKEIISKSWALTKGHKMDLFVLSLSFLGWMLLVPFTLCILLIWLVPYMNITFALVYEDYKKEAK